MDNSDLYKVIARLPGLRYRYLGSFPADLCPRTLPLNKFCIVNTDVSNDWGTHWILLANKAGTYFYGDSMGNPLSSYRNIEVDYTPTPLVTTKLQQAGLCGLYCILFAYKLFSNKCSTLIDDYDVVRFFSMFL